MIPVPDGGPAGDRLYRHAQGLSRPVPDGAGDGLLILIDTSGCLTDRVTNGGAATLGAAALLSHRTGLRGEEHNVPLWNEFTA